LHYNHLKPHAAFNNKPPIPLKNHLNKPVDDPSINNCWVPGNFWVLCAWQNPSESFL